MLPARRHRDTPLVSSIYPTPSPELTPCQCLGVLTTIPPPFFESLAMTFPVRSCLLIFIPLTPSLFPVSHGLSLIAYRNVGR